MLGGEKYLYDGILFKFACDWKNMYGGDEYAMKVASHDFKSCTRFYGSGVAGVHVPFMVKFLTFSVSSVLTEKITRCCWIIWDLD